MAICASVTAIGGLWVEYSTIRATSSNAKCPGAEEKLFHDSNGSIPTTGVVDGRQGICRG
ncbi:hypothetical protein EYF80_012968 [Liparis tanakae]|uniref:Uncharacterized protein n=1 Tax=Liparis tanakae TaxID=230148 RepID=A0A4Z2IFA5_9TELE|nr:hypothetical protein EYF80_012968 [Liparis tanakae]